MSPGTPNRRLQDRRLQDCLRVAEEACGAKFLSQKLRLLSGTWCLLERGEIDDQQSDDWLSATDPLQGAAPAERFLRYLLFRFRKRKSPRTHAVMALYQLESQVLSTPSAYSLYQDSSRSSYLM